MASAENAQPPNLGDVLVNQGVINRSQLAKAQEAQKTNPISLGRILVQLGFISEKTRTSALQLAFGFEPLDMAKHPLDGAVAELIPAAFAEKHRIFPVRLEGKSRLIVAMEDPSDAVVLDAVAHQTKLEVKPLIASSAELTAMLAGKGADLAPKKGPPERGKLHKALKLAFFPTLAFGPLVAFLVLLELSESFTGLISENVHSRFDATIYVGLGWGTWAIIIFYINDVLFGKSDDEDEAS